VDREKNGRRRECGLKRILTPRSLDGKEKISEHKAAVKMAISQNEQVREMTSEVITRTIRVLLGTTNYCNVRRTVVSDIPCDPVFDG
jgi:hypothetical protein